MWVILSAIHANHSTVEFFVGIGDINSAFLPKLEPLTPNLPQDPASAGVAKIPPINIPPPEASTSPAVPAPDLDITAEEQAELVELAKTEILARNADALDAQLEERPLAKMQEQLQDTDESAEAPTTNGTNGHAEAEPESETTRSAPECRSGGQSIIVLPRKSTISVFCSLQCVRPE